MGQKTSALRVVASVSVPDFIGHIDKVMLTRPKNSCWGQRKKVLATFTFTRSGWQPLVTSVLRNTSSSHAAVRQESLGRRPTDTPVKVVFLAGGCPVLRASLSLGGLLEGLEKTRDGNTSSLFFSLAVGGHCGLLLCCNGIVCSTDAVHPRHQQELLKVQVGPEGDAQRSPEAQGAHEGLGGKGPSVAEAEKDFPDRKDSTDGEYFSAGEKEESSDGEKDSFDGGDSSKEEKEESSDGEDSSDDDEEEEDAGSFDNPLREDLTKWWLRNSPLIRSPRTPFPSQEGLQQQESFGGQKDSFAGEEEDAGSSPNILWEDFRQWWLINSPSNPSLRTPLSSPEGVQQQQQGLRRRHPETPARMETADSFPPRGTAAHTWEDDGLGAVVLFVILAAYPLWLLYKTFVE